ncbi:unnamed protein product [marine sediment metagenome]|uniref:Uncharacterized protein n=1 Tax=marine sediment metagenome TaxID=412755 RepID=X0WIH8_9ZZZZ
MGDSELFDRGLFDEPGTGLSVAITATSGVLGLDVSASGESDASLISTAGDLTKVGFPSVGAKSLRNMAWGRIP